MRKKIHGMCVPLTIFLLFCLSACGVQESALYQKYKIPNEEFYGKRVFSTIDQKCSEEDKKSIEEVMETAKYVFAYTGERDEARKDVGALKVYYFFPEDYPEVEKFGPDISKKTEVNYDLELITAIINNNKGYMWVVYSVERIDPTTRETVHGSWNILTKWNVEEIDGHWQVTSINEAP